MKSKRNDDCPCGSQKKYKNCCGNKQYNVSNNNFVKWSVAAAVGVFFIVLLWGLIEHFSTDHPEMEAFKCDNPNCGRIHYRQKTDTN